MPILCFCGMRMKRRSQIASPADTVPNLHAESTVYLSIGLLYFVSRLALRIISLRFIAASTPMPEKTTVTPSHCALDRSWLKTITDRSMVKSLRVTVTITNVRLPKC